MSNTISVDYEPRAWAKELHYYSSTNQFRNFVIIAHRSAGKSYYAAAEAIMHCLRYEGAKAVIVAPYRSQAKAINWNTLKVMLRNIPCTIRESELEVYFDPAKYGRRLPSTIKLLGSETESTRGLRANLLIVDELDNIDYGNFEHVILPICLGSTQGTEIPFVKKIYIGTMSPAFSRLQRLYHKLKDDKDSLCAILKPQDTKVLTEEDLEDLRKAISERAFAIEVMCDDTVPSDDSILGDFVTQAEKDGRVTSVPLVESVPVVLWFDLGIRDATAVWHMQLLGGNFRFIRSEEYRNTSIVDIVRECESHYRTPRIIRDVILPHDARNRSLALGMSIEDVMRLECHKWPFIVERSSVLTRVEWAREAMQYCVFDREKCELGLTRLKQWSWKVDRHNDMLTPQPVHDQSSHMADSFTYGCGWLKKEGLLDIARSVNGQLESYYTAEGTSTGVKTSLRGLR